MTVKDTQFMTAQEKEKVLKQWETFLKHGCQAQHFTQPLYHHLIQHCEFIAHYNRADFFSTYFESGDDTAQFLSQFDNRKGLPQSIEYGGTGWLTGAGTEDYHDINHAMVDVADKYMPGLLDKARSAQRDSDLQYAMSLLAKHGIQIS